MARSLAVQLYTVRDKTQQDFAAALRKVAQIGYDGVELAGLGALSAEAVADAIKASGLKVCGAHIGISEFEKDLPATLKNYAKLGCKDLIVPFLPADRRADIAGWKNFAKRLNEIGREVQKEGFRLGYHNHSFEFALLQKGGCGMDILIDETDPQLVRFELDCFWVVHGGRCPVCFLRKHARRMVFLHLKDMSDPQQRKFANVGTGLLDFPAIVQAGTDAGVRWYVVEQDDCYGQDTFDAIRTSYANLRALNLF